MRSSDGMHFSHSFRWPHEQDRRRSGAIRTIEMSPGKPLLSKIFLVKLDFFSSPFGQVCRRCVFGVFDDIQNLIWYHGKATIFFFLVIKISEEEYMTVICIGSGFLHNSWLLGTIELDEKNYLSE
jgi:hypothetical protein